MKATLLVAAALSLASVSAFGADLEMPMKAPLVPAPFLGPGAMGVARLVVAGGKRTSTILLGIVSSISDFTSANLRISGYMLGGQLGCDYQFTPNWVIRR